MAGSDVRAREAELEEPRAAAALSSDRALLRLARELQRSGYRFTTVTPATHARVNARPANRWARSLVDVFGWSRPFQAELLPPSLFELMRRADVLARHGDGWRSRVRLSSLGGRLLLHSAYPTGEADSVFFGPDSYRFAAAIAQQLADRRTPVRRAVDIGCGAGPGVLVLASALPRAELLGVDINRAALWLARINATLAGAGNVAFRRSDLLAAVDGDFDLVVANPPYLLDPAGRAYRHGGGALGAGLSLAIIEAALTRLAPGGSLLLYTGAAIVDGVDHFRAAAEARLRGGTLHWSYRELDPDVFGEELACEAYAAVDRIAAVLLTATREG